MGRRQKERKKAAMTYQRLDNLFSLCQEEPLPSLQLNARIVLKQEAQDKEMLVVIYAGEVEDFILQSFWDSAPDPTGELPALPHTP